MHSPTIDIAAEAAVLGSVFLDPTAIDDIYFLEVRDFSPVNGLIYEVMRYLHNNDMPVDAVTIARHFQKRGRLESIGGMSYLVELAQSSPSAANAKHYARTVRSLALRRRALEVADKVRALAMEDIDDDDEFLAKVNEHVSDLEQESDEEMLTLRGLKNRYKEHLKTKAAKLLTGYRLFDAWAGGIWRGWLHVLAGRPGAGKTAKAIGYTMGVIKNNPVSTAGAIAFFSQEMDAEEIIDRMVSAESGISYKRLINKGGDNGFEDGEWQRIDAAYKKFEDYPLYIQDSAGVTIDEIYAKVKKLKKKHGKIALVIVDYLQIMSIPQKKNEQRSQAIGRVTQKAKQIARRMKCTFLLLSQLSRDSESRGEPKLSDLKESGSIEQDADVVEFLWYDGQSSKDGRVINNTFAKGRNIGVNSFKLLFKWWIQKFEEVELDAAGNPKR